MLLLSQFVLLNYTTSTADIKNTFSRHASCNTCRWKTTRNSAPPSRITAVPCTQMQAGIPAKKGKTPCTSTPCSHREWQNETTFHREWKCPVALLPALPSASVSFWIGFVLLLCQDVVGLNRWEERVYQWRTLRLYSSRVFPRLVLITGENGLSW